MDKKPAASEKRTSDSTVRKMKFRASGMVKERHTEKQKDQDELYCVSWSSDIFIKDDYKQHANRKPTETTHPANDANEGIP
jgi:hypothetical protein